MKAILEQRGHSYADIEDNSVAFFRIMSAIGIQIPAGMTPVQFHCMSNVATKMARFATGDRTHEDTFLDCANYMVLLAAQHRRSKM